MLKSKKMSQAFWTKVVDCVVYLWNHSPNQSVWNKPPKQAWNGRKLRISEYLEAFHILMCQIKRD